MARKYHSCNLIYAAKYREKNRSSIRKKSREYYERRRIKIINNLGGKCARCGESDLVVLDLDHINNDGFMDNVRHTLDRCTPDKYQVLCKNCNWRKEHELRRAIGTKNRQLVIGNVIHNTEDSVLDLFGPH